MPKIQVDKKTQLEIRQHLADTMPKAGGMARAKQCAAFLDIGKSTFDLYVKQGRIRKPVKMGARVSVWPAEYIRGLAESGIPAIEEGA